MSKRMNKVYHKQFARHKPHPGAPCTEIDRNPWHGVCLVNLGRDDAPCLGQSAAGLTHNDVRDVFES